MVEIDMVRPLNIFWEDFVFALVCGFGRAWFVVGERGLIVFLVYAAVVFVLHTPSSLSLLLLFFFFRLFFSVGLKVPSSSSALEIGTSSSIVELLISPEIGAVIQA